MKEESWLIEFQVFPKKLCTLQAATLALWLAHIREPVISPPLPACLCFRYKAYSSPPGKYFHLSWRRGTWEGRCFCGIRKGIFRLGIYPKIKPIKENKNMI